MKLLITFLLLMSFSPPANAGGVTTQSSSDLLTLGNLRYLCYHIFRPIRGAYNAKIYLNLGCGCYPLNSAVNGSKVFNYPCNYVVRTQGITTLRSSSKALHLPITKESDRIPYYNRNENSPFIHISVWFNMFNSHPRLFSVDGNHLSP